MVSLHAGSLHFGTTIATPARMNIMRMLPICFVLVAFGAGCHDKRPAEGPAERAGRKVDDAASKTKEKTKEAAEDTKDAAEDAKKKAKKKAD